MGKNCKREEFSAKTNTRVWLANVHLLLILFFAGLIFAGPAFAGSFDPDSIVFVQIDKVSRDDLRVLTGMGVDIATVNGGSLKAFLVTDLLEAVSAAGYNVTVLPMPGKDSSLRTTVDSPTFEELEARLQSLAEQYPTIFRISSIGQSVDGRDLWVMKISDNPDMEEDEPEVSFIASMHGNEPVGMDLCIRLIEHIGARYESDEDIRHLVDESQIWILPLMNPDGYVALSRFNADGIDLNRAFPDRVDDPINTTVNRPPEAASVMNWVFAERPVLSANFHTGTMVVNYPYDSDPDDDSDYSATDDDDLFREISLTYSRLNPPMYNYVHRDFENGIVNGVDWYRVYGGMQDWHYVWQGSLHVTIEVWDGFGWPSEEKLDGLWEDNRDAMLAYLKWSTRGIRGIVADRVTGVPLQAALSVAGSNHVVYTDPDVGDYHRILLPGTYDLTCTAEGYLTKVMQEIEVTAEDAAQVDFSLIPMEMDVNDDLSFDLADIILVLKMLNNASAPGFINAPDVNGDGRTGLEEVIYLLRVLGEL